MSRPGGILCIEPLSLVAAAGRGALPVLAEAPFSEVGWQHFAIYNHGCKIAVYGKHSPDFQKRAAEV